MSAIALLGTALWRPGTAAAQQGGVGRETAIDFAAEGSITDWHAENDRQLYIMDRTGRWYLATLSGPCPQLASSPTIRFQPSLGGRFDRFSMVISSDVSCRVESLVRAERPAAKGGKDRS